VTLLEALAIVVAGTVAGGVNAVVGSGSLITFPTLLAVGYSPVTANVSNTVGLVPGGVSGMIGYRRELRGQWRRCAILGIGTTAGAVIGGVLLLELPAAVFDAVVPALILLAVALMAIRPSPKVHEGGDNVPAGVAASFFTGIYGGYFGAAQGVLIVGLMSALTAEGMQSITGLKNLLTTAVNAVAAVAFLVFSPESVDWTAVALIAAGATLGGVAGARFGRRLSPVLMRALIVVVGLAAIARMLLFG
jgi:uncharacterized membrane protein YfcA